MGPLIAIIGRPNVGKSTLFNSLIGENLSLVADFPGLTRDRKYGSTNIQNSSYIFIDTAGISDKDDDFEKLILLETNKACLLYTSPSPRDLSTSRMPSSA